MLNVIKNFFLIACAIAKYYLPFQLWEKYIGLPRVHTIASVAFAAVLLAVLYSILFPFTLIYFCLDNVLKLMHGKLYGGILNGTDVIFETEQNKCVINVVFIFTCKDNRQVLIEKLKERAFQLHQANFKFSSKIKNILGYLYYLKDQVKFEEIADTIDYNDQEYITKNDLLDYLENNCLPIEKDQMWSAVFFSQPIKWHTSQTDATQLALVLTFRHALGDYPCIIGYIKKYFQLAEDSSISKPYSTSNINEVCLNVNNVRILQSPLCTLLDGPGLTLGDNLHWLAASFIEEKAEYIPKIKNIKRELDVTFMEVLSAAVAASMSSHIKQRKIKLNSIAMVKVVRPIKEEVSEIVNGTFNFNYLANNSGTLIYNVPLESKEGNMKCRILDIHRYNQQLTYAVENIYMYMMCRYVATYIPARLVEFFLKHNTKNVTAGISNVVGLSATTCCGSTVDDIFFFAPNFANLGCLFFVHSYAGRFQVTVTCRRGFVHNKEELESILNNVIENIDEAVRDINVNEKGRCDIN